ncbi:SRPBCC family protein [Stigmatella aurantiaca]|uniref:Activator of Hsp90 ATPase-like protein n=1 Tax=Stigmatella aurantiaca (strain DW4/3-1) TaxID=378806 RepID=Q08QM1_STIAD|nr:SRPBCC family protein [Stigmatella aurantiaca]ADO74049.1 Activator of Hsp90 ATPase-like protein [Stigmatella aurantiaca DW4/3-1]EAU62785.1 CalU19 [Stigmatella aurantiaca DW4/3-1]
MLHKVVGAEVREFVEREHEGKPARVMIASRLYHTGAEDLWDAVTSAERLPRWFLPIEGDLRLGGRYQLQGNAGGTITRCEPPKAFDVTWEFGGGMSWVTVRLAPEGKDTRLTLEHIVPASDEDKHWTQFGPSAVGVGWDLGFLGLGRHIESGGGVPPEADPAWMASDEAKTFMRASADAWAAAHVKGGEAPEVARGMAERTAAFYTGG